MDDYLDTLSPPPTAAQARPPDVGSDPYVSEPAAWWEAGSLESATTVRTPVSPPFAANGLFKGDEAAKGEHEAALADLLTTLIPQDSSDVPLTIPFQTDEERWEAVVNRTVESDGWFVYCVKTTKCACRPTCPARRAARANVVFFDLVPEAVAAGYRPCKRCKPDEERDPTTKRRDEAVQGAYRAMERAAARGEKMPGLGELARNAGISPFHFHRMFTAQVGKTPKKVATELAAIR